MRTVFVYWPLSIGFLYFFSLLWHFNHGIHGEPLYAVIAGTILLTSLAFMYYLISLSVVLTWTKINSQSFLLKVFRFLVTPYVTLFWVVRYDYSIVLVNRYTVLLAVVLATTLLFESKHHLIWCDNWGRLKSDTEKLLGSPPWSIMDMLPLVLFYLFFCSIFLIFPSTYLDYAD
jgi:hypothetical protein